MKRSYLLLVVFMATGSTLFAKDNSTAHQVLDSARRQEVLFQNESQPLQAEVDFTAQMAVPEQGHLTLKWESKDRWWTKVDIAGYEQIKIRDGEWEYTKRNLPFTPVRIGNLFKLLSIDSNPARMIAGKERIRKEGGNTIHCVKSWPEHHKNELHDVCVDPATGAFVRDDWRWAPVESWRIAYSDYFEIDGHTYPRKLEMLNNESRVVSATLESVKAIPFDATLLTPPKEAISRRICPGMQPPKLVKETYPDFGDRVDLPGQTTVALTILTDGSIGDIQLVGRGGEKLDDRVLATIKNWRFRPAMCGDTPVVEDIQVEVNLVVR